MNRCMKAFLHGKACGRRQGMACIHPGRPAGWKGGHVESRRSQARGVSGLAGGGRAPVGRAAHEARLRQQALQRGARAQHRRRAPQLALERVAHQQRLACARPHARAWALPVPPRTPTGAHARLAAHLPPHAPACERSSLRPLREWFFRCQKLRAAACLAGASHTRECGARRRQPGGRQGRRARAAGARPRPGRRCGPRPRPGGSGPGRGRR